MKTKYNKTQLNPDATFEKHIYHRDQFAHYLRWTHVLKRIEIGEKILDFGCGSGNMAEVMYRNLRKPRLYLGLDIRKQTIESCIQRWSKIQWAKWKVEDLVEGNFDYGSLFTFITCFEVIEHIGKWNADKFLLNIRKHMNNNTTLFISTPCYDEAIGAANNHIIVNPETNEKTIGEFTYDEMRKLLNKYFIIIHHYGTFASIKDYKQYMNEWQRKFYEFSHEYFDSNILSNIMAPMFPEHSRNVLWICKLKGG